MDALQLSRFSGFLFFVLFCPLFSSGQGLKNDKAFFLAQQETYRQWLDMSGMGKLLKVHTVTVEEDKVNLYLEIPSPYSDRDSLADYALSAWRELRSEFNKENSIGLEEQLFLKMLHMMELEPEQATVQLYDTYDPRLNIYMFYGIYYENDGIKVDSSLTKATFHSFQVYVPALAKSAQTGLNIQKSKAGLNAGTFDSIYAFVQKRFGPAKAVISEKLVDLEKGIYVLSIQPLYEEVIKNQQNQVICEWLRRLDLNCTTLKKEWLTLTFALKPASYGYQLDCILNGQCLEKNSLWTERGEYKNIDHDLKSWQILKDYGDSLMTELRHFLQ